MISFAKSLARSALIKHERPLIASPASYIDALFKS